MNKEYLEAKEKDKIAKENKEKLDKLIALE